MREEPQLTRPPGKQVGVWGRHGEGGGCAQEGVGSLFSSVPDLPRWPGHRGLAALGSPLSPAPRALLGGASPCKECRCQHYRRPNRHPDPSPPDVGTAVSLDSQPQGHSFLLIKMALNLRSKIAVSSTPRISKGGREGCSPCGCLRFSFLSFFLLNC